MLPMGSKSQQLLNLEGGDGNRPQPRAAADLDAALGGIDVRRPRDRRRTVEPLGALDGQHLPPALPPSLEAGEVKTDAQRIDRRRRRPPYALG